MILSRRHLFAILLGFLVVIAIGIVLSSISFLIYSNAARKLSPDEFRNISLQQPYLAFNMLSKIIYFVLPVLGGFVVGWLVKEKGWLYGGLLGIMLIFISIVIAALPLLLPATYLYGQNIPPNYSYDLAQKNILNQLFNSPLTIALTVLGGLLGEKLHRSKSK